MKNKSLVLLIVFLSLFVASTSSQENNESNEEYIQTAGEYLALVEAQYGKIKDLKATLEIDGSTGKAKGTIFVKPPNKVRINFTKPQGQVINNDGRDFYVYIPEQNMVLHQKKRNITNVDESGTGFVTETGISQLRKNYLASFVDTPEYVPLESDPSKKVIKILLRWRNTSQNFRSLALSIGEDNFIYQVDAVMFNRKTVKFTFSNLEINKGIPDSRFDYKAPATASVIDKFLFDEETTKDE